MRGVDFDAAECSGDSEAHDVPVVPGSAAAARLPTAAHVVRAAREQEVVARAEEHVAADQRPRAVFQRGKIDQAAEALQLAQIGQHFAVHPEPRNAAVGKDVEAQVGEAAAVADGEFVLAIALQRRAREDFDPLRLL